MCVRTCVYAHVYFLPPTSQGRGGTEPWAVRRVLRCGGAGQEVPSQMPKILTILGPAQNPCRV